MNIRKLFFFHLLFFTALLNAQPDFRPGYIIKFSGDSLVGKIDYRSDLIMANKCRFKNYNDEIFEFTPDDVVAFRFIDSKFYVSREVNGKKVFLEYLIKGKVNIYYLYDDTGEHYFLDKEDVPLTEIPPYTEELRVVNKKNVLYESTRHMGVLSYYMQDAPNIQPKIKSVKKPEHWNLIKLAEQYHNAVCEDEKCIIYEKKQTSGKVILEVLGGTINYENIDNLNDKFYFQTGLLVHLWMPKSNEKLFFKTGFLYSHIEDAEKKIYSYFKFPAHIGYIAPSTFTIRPTLSVGLLSPDYSGGIYIKASEKIDFGILSWVGFDYKNIPWVPNQLIRYSFLGSMRIAL